MKSSFFKTNLAYENWKKKYQFGDETPIETFKRIAKSLASVEKNPEEWEEKFLHTLVKFDEDGNPIGLKCTPGGRTTANAGTTYDKATLMNCFINGPVRKAEIKYVRRSEDGLIENTINMNTPDTPDDLVNIFLTIMEQAKTLASEGGYGINFGFIRPRGSLIKGTGIRHPGIVSYMDIWDAVSECIVKGDNDGYSDNLKNYLTKEEFDEVKSIVKKQTRKGAMLGALPVWHPDIEEFIRAKQEPGRLTKFNISVLIDDAFMEAVENDEMYDLHFDGRVYKRVKAKHLYDLIMKSTYNRAEPGVLFYDNMRRNNPIQYLGDCNCTNPCGEIPGNPYLTTVCLLGSVNLTQYVFIDEKGNPKFDFDQYKNDVEVFSRMLDNVNDLTDLPLPAYEWAVKNNRQFGMGLNGVGSTLMMLKIRYGSEESIKFVEELVRLKENITWQVSAKLAAEKGTFPLYDKEKFTNTDYFRSVRLSEETKKMIMEYGVRNAKTTTNPPLGNTSVICNNVSNGIEPVYDLKIERKVICDWPEGLNSSNVKKILKEEKEKDFIYWKGEFNGQEYYYEPHNRGLCEIHIMRDYGYQWLLENFSDIDKEYVVTTKNLEIEDHINIQEVVQFYCNQSVSKTCNIPKNYSFTKFKNLYLVAWKKGLIGFTTYREGSMESVLSSLEKAEEKKEIMKKDIKLPEVFSNGPTTTIKREGAKFYIHFSYLPDDKELRYPVAMWIHTNAKKETVACNRACKSLTKLAIAVGIDQRIIDDTWEKCLGDYPHNRLARMISLCMRHNVPREDILVALTNIEGDNISSLLTAVRKFIGSTIEDGREILGFNCSECGENLVMESGCFVCKNCGHALCS